MKSTALIIVLFSVVFNLYSFNDTYLGISYSRLISIRGFTEYNKESSIGGGAGKGYALDISFQKRLSKYFAYSVGISHSHIDVSQEAKAKRWLPVQPETNFVDPDYALYDGYDSYSMYFSPIFSLSSTSVYFAFPFHLGYNSFGEVKYISANNTYVFLQKSDPAFEICLATGIGKRITLNEDISIDFSIYHYFPTITKYKACLDYSDEGHVVRWETRRNFFKLVTSAYFKLN